MPITRLQWLLFPMGKMSLQLRCPLFSKIHPLAVLLENAFLSCSLVHSVTLIPMAPPICLRALPWFPMMPPVLRVFGNTERVVGRTGSACPISAKSDRWYFSLKTSSALFRSARTAEHLAVCVHTCWKTVRPGLEVC